MAEKKGPFEGILDESTAAWARGKTIEELTFVDIDGSGYVQENLARFDVVKKRLVDVPVLARFPEPLDYVKARAKAIRYVEEENDRAKNTLTVEGAQALAGHDFGNVERLYLFEGILRRPENPGLPYMLAGPLGRSHPTISLLELEEKLLMAKRMVHQRGLRPEHFENPELFWAIVHAIGEKKNLSPLVAIVDQGTDAFIIAMASQLSAFQTKQSSES